MSADIAVGDCTLLLGDARERLAELPAESVQCCVTSPPYFGLRSYLPDGHPDKEREIGLEQTVDAYVAGLVGVFREVRRVLRPDGVLWLNLGDSYANDGKWGGSTGGKHVGGREGTEGYRLKRQTGLKPKDLIGIPWRVAFALQADGWWLRAENIWHKVNCMPESVTDRPTRAHETVFLLSKAERYFYDAEAVKESAVGKNDHDLTGGKYAAPGQAPHTGSRKALHGPTYSRHRSSVPGGQDLRSIVDGRRNMRSVWTIATEPFAGSHFAVMPTALAERCIKAGCPAGGTVLDPFAGAGTTLLVAERLQRRAIGIELDERSLRLAADRIRDDATLFAGAAA